MNIGKSQTDYFKMEKSRLIEMVDELWDKIGEDLNDWEYRFISNMKHKSWPGDFSDRQKFNIVRIYNKYFSGENFGKN